MNPGMVTTPEKALTLNRDLNRIEKYAKKEERDHGHSWLWASLIGLAGAGLAGYLWWQQYNQARRETPGNESSVLKTEVISSSGVSPEDEAAWKRQDDFEQEGFNTSSPDASL
jgi:cytoskeletal protein RodZ